MSAEPPSAGRCGQQRREGECQNNLIAKAEHLRFRPCCLAFTYDASRLETGRLAICKRFVAWSPAGQDA